MISENLERFRSRILEDRRRLIPLDRIPVHSHQADAAAVIVSQDRPEHAVSMVRKLKKAGNRLKMDIFVMFHCAGDSCYGVFVLTEGYL